MSVVYMAEPIDLGNLILKASLATSVLNELGFTVYRPSQAFVVGGQPDSKVQKINRAALDEADAVFALLSEGVQSVGVPAEVAWAIDAGKPVVLANDLVGSWYLAGWKEAANFRSVGLNPKALRKGAEWLLHTHNDAVFGNGEDDVARMRRMSRQEEKAQSFIERYRSGGLGDPLPLQSIVFEAKTEEAKLPERAYGTDAGFDLFTSKPTVLMPGKTTYVPTGVAVDVPDGWWGLITGRSSTKAKLGLDVVPGVIDEGFSGELLAGVYNPHPHMINVAEGDRLVQIVFIPAIGPGEATWGKVRPKPRGGNGFGSSGRSAMEVEDGPAEGFPL